MKNGVREADVMKNLTNNDLQRARRMKAHFQGDRKKKSWKRQNMNDWLLNDLVAALSAFVDVIIDDSSIQTRIDRRCGQPLLYVR